MAVLSDVHQALRVLQHQRAQPRREAVQRLADGEAVLGGQLAVVVAGHLRRGFELAVPRGEARPVLQQRLSTLADIS